MAEKISKIEILDIEKTIGKKLLQDYIQIIQNKVTNTLTTLNKKSFKNITDDGVGKTEKNGIEISLLEIDNINLSTITWRVLLFLSQKLNDNFNKYSCDLENQDKLRTVSLTVKEYAQLCDMKSLTDARNQLIEAVQAISRIRVSFKEPIYENGKIQSYKGNEMPLVGNVITILDRKQVLKDLEAFKFSGDFINYMLRKRYVLGVPKGIFSLNNKKNPNAFYFGTKILEHMRINKKEKGEKVILGVQTLLASTPEIMPYEEIKVKGKVYEKIIAPFKRDMNELVNKGIIKEWNFCNAKGKPLDAEQKQMKTYEIFKKLYIECE